LRRHTSRSPATTRIAIPWMRTNRLEEGQGSFRGGSPAGEAGGGRVGTHMDDSSPEIPVEWQLRCDCRRGGRGRRARVGQGGRLFPRSKIAWTAHWGTADPVGVEDVRRGWITHNITSASCPGCRLAACGCGHKAPVLTGVFVPGTCAPCSATVTRIGRRGADRSKRLEAPRC